MCQGISPCILLKYIGDELEAVCLVTLIYKYIGDELEAVCLVTLIYEFLVLCPARFNNFSH
jgi:hypothetical protein